MTVLIFALCFANVLLNGVTLYFMLLWKKSQALQMLYLLEKQETMQNGLGDMQKNLTDMEARIENFEMDMQKKFSTVGSVLKIFEDETRILQKRNEQNALKQRFQRQPR